MSDDLDFTDPAFHADPYPYYDRLRAIEPIHWNRDFWVSTRYADVTALLRDPRIGQPPDHTRDELQLLLEQGKLSPLDVVRSHWMLSRNPPDHTRLRGLVSKAFTPAVVESLRPRIQTIVDELLDTVELRGTFDIIEGLAYPLPVMVISELLGVPYSDREIFKQLARDFTGSIDIAPPAEAMTRAMAATDTLIDYFKKQIASHQLEPKNDLLSALLAAHEQGEKLREYELIGNCILLFLAGHETTMNLIGNGMLALLRNPDQLVKLRGDPSRIVDAVEELLRYDSPVQSSGRYILEDVVYGGKLLRRGQSIVFMFGAANRDPAQFSNPDRLDISRSDNRHHAFGYGIHYCLGAPLARVEGQIAISTLVRRMPSLTLHEDGVVWRKSHQIRGLKTLPVS